MTNPARPAALSDSQLDRVEGVLLGQAVGDVMGAPYEPGDIPFTGTPELLGGGFGGYAPGEWSDDTQMSLYIARVAATGADLTSREALDEIARGFCRWVAADGATDVGVQTRRVLGAVVAGRDEPGIAARMRAAAADLDAATRRTGGNGALMRNGIVGLTRLNDRSATAAAARAVAELTHADPLAGDCCVIHAEMIRSAVMAPPWRGGPLPAAAAAMRALDLIPAERRNYWRDLFDGGILSDSRCLEPPSGDGFTVHALGHATLALAFVNRVLADRAARPSDPSGGGEAPTDGGAPPGEPRSARPRADRMDHADRADRILVRALEASEDKDTVAAIAGALAGSHLGASALDPAWVEAIHGLPRRPDGAERRARDLRELARATALSGLTGAAGERG
ncbi:ADP-ribosylglycohydrolase family protein [uncultured Actinomyces sp.]|uniref:ADP-ribosylglycohydrolase family protein n=1 Tax=uncultured Actinomyces sp. TaxID=249061 RepID=UPI00288917EE|nr:ADP-ribosylglycohydrolase family protein [uncultured Actinomyces sp.]